MKSTVDNTYGALFLSIVISSVLYGVGMLQFWIYIRKYHAKDPLILTSLVSAVLIFETFQLAFLCHGGYKYLVSSIADPEIYISVVNSLMIEVFFSCAIATLVQQFYCWRIYKIGNRLFVAAVMSLLSCASSVVLFVYGARAVQLKFLFQVIELKPLGITSMTLTAITDVAISVSMVILLQASKTGYKRTTDMINRLVIFTFNNGLPTAISAILCNVTVRLETRTKTSWPVELTVLRADHPVAKHIPLHSLFLLLAHLYTNSLLVTLNSRDYIKAASDDLEQYSLEGSTVAVRRGSRSVSKLTMPQDSLSGHMAIPIDKGLRLVA
ncbi:hypothetical protein B0H14DRAFT_3873150 [Mycena olivaceomarginata]|nr:hypothetical protein B0H14DRAFT_3873150 [Mycena olivaceomarginata]